MAATIHTVSVHEAKTHLSKLINEVLAGGEVVIARGKEPVIKLVPTTPLPKTKRKLGQWKDKVKFDERFFDPLPDEELKLWNCED